MSPVSSIRVGLIGCGTIAYWQHLRALKRLSGVRIAGLADPDPEALERAARLADAPRFTRAEELLAQDEVDAVVIASPAGLHAAHIQAACQAGKHLFVEKPVAHDAASLAAVRACTGDSGRVFAVGYNFRFHPACRRLRRELRSGSIGAVRAVSSHFTESVDPDSWPGWRRERKSGGGVMLDLATHHLDLYRWLLEDELTGLRAEARTRRFDQDSAWVRASTRGGIDLCGYFAHGGSRSHALTVHGVEGVLQLDMHSGRLVALRDRRLGYGIRTRTVAAGFDGVLWRARKWVQPSYNPSYALALRAFVDAIANPASGNVDLAGLDDGAAALQAVLDAEGAAGDGERLHAAGPGPA